VKVDNAVAEAIALARSLFQEIKGRNIPDHRPTMRNIFWDDSLAPKKFAHSWEQIENRHNWRRM